MAQRQNLSGDNCVGTASGGYSSLSFSIVLSFNPNKLSNNPLIQPVYENLRKFLKNGTREAIQEQILFF